jgi:hypothetical protein
MVALAEWNHSSATPFPEMERSPLAHALDGNTHSQVAWPVSQGAVIHSSPLLRWSLHRGVRISADSLLVANGTIDANAKGTICEVFRETRDGRPGDEGRS